LRLCQLLRLKIKKIFIMVREKKRKGGGGAFNFFSSFILPRMTELRGKGKGLWFVSIGEKGEGNIFLGKREGRGSSFMLSQGGRGPSIFLPFGRRGEGRGDAISIEKKREEKKQLFLTHSKAREEERPMYRRP